jgi:hypothetical protein
MARLWNQFSDLKKLFPQAFEFKKVGILVFFWKIGMLLKQKTVKKYRNP